MARSYTHKTIKLLYGRAKRCAYPGCDEGLIFEHRGRLSVTSEIAHIRSETPDGPRHDPAYPAELINAEENLLVLCGKHHKAVDDHESVYPIEELVAWKAGQAAGGPGRELSTRQVERIYRHYDLGDLGPVGFEQVCQALAIHVLGPETVIPDRYGRNFGADAFFEGTARSYPTDSDPWQGYIAVDVLYSATSRRKVDAVTHLTLRIRDHLHRWTRIAGTDRREVRRPDYLIFATNLSLSGPGGERERVSDRIEPHVDELRFKGWGIWDYDRIADYLDVYPDVRRAVESLTKSNELIAEVLAGLSAGTQGREPRPSSPVVGPGQPGHEGVFAPVYEAAGGRGRLGLAMGEVFEHELGWVQYFTGGPSGEPAVLCARFGQPVVAVAREVWDDIAAVSREVAGGGPTGVGFPLADESERGGYVGSQAEVVELAGGRWGRSGRGRLLRRRPGPPVWQPAVVYDSEAFEERDRWSSAFDTRDLRIRLAARIPLSADEWRITGAGRGRMLSAVERSGLMPVLCRAAARRGLDHGDLLWTEIGEPDGLNNSRFAAYEVVVPGSNDRPAVAICLRLVLPDGRGMDLRTAVDLRVDFGAFDSTSRAVSPESPEDLRWTLVELVDFLTQAWPVATTELLLAATNDPLSLAPAGAPRVELHIQSEQRGTADSGVLDMVDLSPLGAPRATRTGNLSVGVTTPLALPESDVTTVIRSALVWMVEDAGFVTR
ncbi:hypothetical protein FHX81_7976 [Saccharothrix saharensis]|uniref:HNH endonuclease n=1 Tax=Saccharothrix saharensis TaxID=571190 RepID=A0A543JRL9_9PSEU|nr:HNH endonuclease signature motif containing protein [Saccharothrix saharensis]TQM85490.1 hypothetical protein FHX81_7976 [Saccharothrix saharensis]